MGNTGIVNVSTVVGSRVTKTMSENTTVEKLTTASTTGGGGGFFLACKDFGRMFDHSFTACAFYFFEVEISSRTLIRLFIPGSAHSGSAN